MATTALTASFERTVAAQCRSRIISLREGGGGGDDDGDGDDGGDKENETAAAAIVEAKKALLSGWRRALRARRPPPRALLPGSGGDAWPPLAPPDVLDAIPVARLRAAAIRLWTARPPLAMECPELAAAFCCERSDNNHKNNNARRCLRAFEHMRAALAALRGAGFVDGCSGGASGGGGGGGGAPRQLRVYIVMVDQPKLRRPPQMPRGPAQANGGLSFGCARPEILVYRREEWWKVFLHEAIHALSADFSARARRGGGGGGGGAIDGENAAARQEAAEREALAAALFPGARLANAQHLLLNEAFTEASARLWHLAWTAVRRAPESRRRQLRVFDRLLAESRLFAAAQALRWLAPDHDDVGMLSSSSSSATAAATTPPASTTAPPAFYEDTAGLMYYVVAAALLCHPPALLGARQQRMQRCTSATAADSECARIAVTAVRSPAFARIRQQAADLLPPEETSMRMIHVDAAPGDEGGSSSGGGGGVRGGRRSSSSSSSAPSRTRRKTRRRH